MRPRCGDCRHFRGNGADVEAAFPGLSAMSSGYASVRGDDGLCVLQGIYLPAGDRCGSFIGRQAVARPGENGPHAGQ